MISEPGAAPDEAVPARIRRHFDDLLEARGYRADAAQRAAVEQLGAWLDARLRGRRAWFRRAPVGVYLWGGVGRGKSFVMDAFFAAAPVSGKRRVHFHAFLQALQAQALAYAGRPDPLALAARELARHTALLCFDEFHVHDLGDAMLLGRVLSVLVEEGVGLVCTSNYRPDQLCPNPLYRARFKPAIQLIEQRFTVLALDGGIDYRGVSGALEVWGEYCWPLQAGAQAWFERRLGFGGDAVREATLEVNQHPLQVRAWEGDRAWLDFDALCRRPHSSADFLWLCRRFRCIALVGVPALDGEGIDVQQRFLNFIDIAYDIGIRLLLGGEHALETVCRSDSHTDFSRTRSRLLQLQPVHLDPGA